MSADKGRVLSCCGHEAERHGPEAGGCIECRCRVVPGRGTTHDHCWHGQGHPDRSDPVCCHCEDNPCRKGRVSSHDRRCDRDLCHPDCPVRRKRREDQ